MPVIGLQMPTFLQPVDVPERCFLQEVLFWVAFQRLPTVTWIDEGEDVRDTDEIGGFRVEITDSVLDEDETAKFGIPTDPRWISRVEGSPSGLPVSFYDDFLARDGVDEGTRREFERARDDAIAFEQQEKSWWPQYQRAIEYPASKIFVALRSGSLRMQGRLLPGDSIETTRSMMEEHEIFDIAATDILPTFWSLKGIDFDASAACNGAQCYCHVSCRTDDLFAEFPPEGDEVTGIRRIGDSFLLSDNSGAVRRMVSSRGR